MINSQNNFFLSLDICKWGLQTAGGETFNDKCVLCFSQRKITKYKELKKWYIVDRDIEPMKPTNLVPSGLKHYRSVNTVQLFSLRSLQRRGSLKVAGLPQHTQPVPLHFHSHCFVAPTASALPSPWRGENTLNEKTAPGIFLRSHIRPWKKPNTLV